MNSQSNLKNITKEKWINVDKSFNVWTTVITPQILNFITDKEVITNFSNYKFSYLIINNELIIDDIRRYRLELKDKTLFLIGSDGERLCYKKVEKGDVKYSKTEIQKKISSKRWYVENKSFDFKFPDLFIYDENDQPLRSGFCSLYFFNDQIFLIYNIDGEYELKTMVLKSFGVLEIVFVDLNDSSFLVLR